MPEEMNQFNQQPSFPSEPVTPQPPRQRNVKKTVLIILGVLVLIVASALATIYLIKEYGPESDDTVQTTQEETLQDKLKVVYEEQDGSLGDVSFNTPIVQDSGTEGYQYARVGVTHSEFEADSEAVFYRLPDESWHFFTITADLDKISCEEYDSEDLVSAFLGFTCWDVTNNESSYVERENPEFEVEEGALGG